MYKSLWNSNFDIKKDYNWSCLLFKTKLCSLPSPHAKFSLNKNMPNYNRFQINCYLKVTCNSIMYYYQITISIKIWQFDFMLAFDFFSKCVMWKGNIIMHNRAFTIPFKILWKYVKICRNLVFLKALANRSITYRKALKPHNLSNLYGERDND